MWLHRLVIGGFMLLAHSRVSSLDVFQALQPPAPKRKWTGNILSIASSTRSRIHVIHVVIVGVTFHGMLGKVFNFRHLMSGSILV